MPLNPKIETVEKIVYKCHSCGEKLRRKPTEESPKACNYCHTTSPAFTVVAK